MKNLIDEGILKIAEGTLKINERAYYENDEIVKVIFPESLKEIGEEAFASCHNIKEIVCPNNLEVIGPGAFFENINLEKLVLNEGLKTIYDGAFLSCKKIKKIEFPKSLKKIPTMCFYGCSFNILNIPGNIKEIDEQAFWDNEELVEVNILNPEVNLGADIFGCCYKLKQGYIACGYPLEGDENDELLYSLLGLSNYEKHTQEIKEAIKDYASNNERIVMEKIFKTNNTKALNTMIQNDLIKGNIEEYLQTAFNYKLNEMVALLLQNKTQKEDLSL